VKVRFLWKPDPQYSLLLEESRKSQFQGDGVTNSIVQGGAAFTGQFNRALSASTSTHRNRAATANPTEYQESRANDAKGIDLRDPEK